MVVGVRATPKGTLAERAVSIEDCANDDGEEFFTKIHLHKGAN